LRPSLLLRFRTQEQYDAIKKDAESLDISVNEFVLRKVENHGKVSERREPLQAAQVQERTVREMRNTTEPHVERTDEEENQAPRNRRSEVRISDLSRAFD
jgi:hypothetical protein